MHNYRFSWILLILPIAVFLLLRPERSSAPTGASTTQPVAAKISAIVLPHHDIVKQQRQEFLAEVVKQIPQPETIILLSPNHYESGSAAIQTTTEQWDTSLGPIEPNTSVIEALVKSGVGDEGGSFSNEHGIKLVLGDLERTFPEASIVPLILKSSVDAGQVEKLATTLEQTCYSCLLVASVDFSHYQPAILADLHDSVTQRLLENRDQAGLLKTAEVDSPAALALMANWAERHDTRRFTVHNHTNSGVLTNNTDIETTSHLFGWYETGEPVTPEPSVTFLLGGDMMFGRMIVHTFLPKLESSLDQLGNRAFWGTDAGIVNLEGPVSDVAVPQSIEPNNLVFHFPPETIKALEYLKVNGASLANNHSQNAGSNGYETTVKLLKDAGMQPIGGPSHGQLGSVGVFKGQDLTLYVIGVHALAEQPDLTDQIRTLKADPKARVLVFPHWGNEYQAIHSRTQAALAHAWIDAGADLVIGAHPHVIQDAEVYNGKPIFYSVGNLLFDQTFSKETQQGLLIGGRFLEDRLELFVLPVESHNLKPRLMRGSAKQAILNKLYEPFKDSRQQGQAGDLLSFPKSGVE